MSDLISLKTRQAFREYLVGWKLREISEEFDAAKVDCDLAHQPNYSGERRTLVEQYYHTVDWSDPASVRRVLRVFEAVLHQAEYLAQEVDTPENQLMRKRAADTLIYCLKRDGFLWTEDRIVSGTGIHSLASIKSTADVFDAGHMKEQIRRMESSIESDPSLAIGTAKELIETCCKTILAERGKPVVGTPDVSILTKETLKVLNLVPEGIPDASRGSDIIKRLLQNLGTIGNNLAELRGLYGTGHGKHGRVGGLAARHAKLAVGAASTLAVFLFETHNEIKG